MKYLLLVLYFFFAQLRTFFIGGKYSAKIIMPGMPKTHPWKIGIRPPIIPIKTKRIPKATLRTCLTIYIEYIRLFSRSFLKFLAGFPNK